MPYCLKCGTKVDDSNTFCPNCGTQLKDSAATPAATAASPAPNPEVKAEEKKEPDKPKASQEPPKIKKPERPDRGFIKYLAAGLILVTLGVSMILELTNPKYATGEDLAIMLLVIGLIVILSAVYAAFFGRKHASS